MADINLLQNKLKDSTVIASRRNSVFIWIAVLILLVLGGLGAWLYMLTDQVTTKNTELAVKNSQITKQISSASEDLGEAKIFQAKLENIDLLLDKHTYMSPLLDEIEKVTYVNSQYVNADISFLNENEIHLEGNANTYTDLGKLVLGLSTSKYFTNVKLLAVVPTTIGAKNGFHYSIDLTALPALLNK